MSTKKNQKVSTTNVSTANGVVQYEILDDVPMPTRPARGKASRFPFATLKPKQAFKVSLK